MTYEASVLESVDDEGLDEAAVLTVACVLPLDGGIARSSGGRRCRGMGSQRLPSRTM